MPLQFKNIAVGNLQDDVSGNNYAANKAVYILNLNNTLAQIFSDETGTIPIVQDGVNNVTNSKGVFGFWVEAGDYFVQVGANKYRVSITGADYFNNRVDETVDLIVDAVAGRGAYYPVGSFEAGFTYTDINQVGTFGTAPNITYYVYTGGLTNLNHPVPAGTDPNASSDYAQVFYNASSSVINNDGTSAQDTYDKLLPLDRNKNISDNGIVHASEFGLLANSNSDQSANLEAALSTGKRIDITGMGLVKVGSEMACGNGVRLISFDDISGITGYDGLGARVTGGLVTLENVGIFGFYDGTDQNKNNIGTAFCRVSSGTSLDKVGLYRVRGNNNRSIVVAGAEGDDFNPDTTISTRLLEVINCDIRNTSIPVNWRSLCERDVCVGNNYENIIGAGRIVAAHKVYLDGLNSDSGFYEQCTDHLFAHNKVKTVVNRTTTGDSSSGNNYECHALMVSGEVLHAHDNTIKDCTGNRYDTEGFYLKCKNFNIHDNVLVDSGALEGSICIKGVNSDVGVQPGPIGDKGNCSKNIIIYTRDSYNNNGVLVDLSSSLLGIYLGVPSHVDVTNNDFTGCNVADVIVDGYPGSKNENVSVCDNDSYDLNAQASIIWNGAFYNAKSNRNSVIRPLIPATLGRFTHTTFESVSGRGLDNYNNECLDNDLIADVSDGRFNSKIISMVSIDLENFDHNGFKTGGNTFDVKIGSATPDIRVNYVRSQSGSGTGVLKNLVATPDTVKTPLKVSQWIWGVDRVDTFDITSKMTNFVTNELFLIAQYPTVNGKVLSIEAKTDFSFSANGETGTRWRIGTYYNNAGSASIQNQADIYSYRAASTGDMTLDANGILGRVRLTNNTANTMKAVSVVRATSI